MGYYTSFENITITHINQGLRKLTNRLINDGITMTTVYQMKSCTNIILCVYEAVISCEAKQFVQSMLLIIQKKDRQVDATIASYSSKNSATAIKIECANTTNSCPNVNGSFSSMKGIETLIGVVRVIEEDGVVRITEAVDFVDGEVPGVVETSEVVKVEEGVEASDAAQISGTPNVLRTHFVIIN
ncbi:uncharacterized protein LOC117179784 isoform X1 [Belonocnema kinseyi]|uniref:uncharacterized protein LOC117179784 isoform X1 n=1 Tax=Belonocnema kinseyi TaxID=2817044 RepID=UPI00143DD82C|nr:uncharacterized protein LOC117179784 isoform X1 [Belonocnema kinseyi]XP_033227778.1 uncharacterized protein LOC117179784 isoform X1 [Belonocnema kinseyi]XP_033227779.1 uncharacterized protein LOC117179784 isoform X1 [Belonocnema kinseyi]